MDMVVVEVCNKEVLVVGNMVGVVGGSISDRGNLAGI